MTKEQFKKWIMSMLYYRYKIKATENGEFLGMVDDNIDLLLQAERERCAVIALALDSLRGNEKEIAKAIRNKK